MTIEQNEKWVIIVFTVQQHMLCLIKKLDLENNASLFVFFAKYNIVCKHGMGRALHTFASMSLLHISSMMLDIVYIDHFKYSLSYSESLILETNCHEHPTYN